MTTAKEIIFEDAAREKLKEGINTLADIVAVTLGPKGRSIGIDDNLSTPLITSDGYSIVKEIELKDDFINIGVLLAKEMTQKIKDKCGDGTTTGIILFREIVKEGIKLISSGYNPILIKKEIEQTTQTILNELNKMTTPITNDEEMKNIAYISAAHDKEIANTIFESFKQAGKKGVITLEEAKGIDTVIETSDGLSLEQGYLSAYFSTNMEKLIVEMHDADILITDKKISTIHDILNILQRSASLNKNLLIIADDVEGDALSTIVVNKLKGTLKVAAIKAPGFGDNRKEILEDIATITGGTMVSEDKGMRLKDMECNVLGSCEKVVITKDKTTIINGRGVNYEIQNRIAKIDAEIKQTTSAYDREKLEERRAKLSGGVVIIRIGALTEPELKRKKQIYEDGLNSTRAALEEGIVIGGGIALLRASLAIKDKNIGASILTKACQMPLRQIIKNTAGNDSLLLEKIINSPKTFGFNALSEQVEDLIQAGVIDAVKVVKNSLLHAISTACIVLLSEVLITEEKKTCLKS
jgi:chaperonin GroEL